MTRVLLALILAVVCLAGQQSSGQRPKKPKRSSAVAQQAESGPTCSHECTCRRKTRQIQDEAEEACRQAHPDPKDEERSKCLHSIPAHCDLLGTIPVKPYDQEHDDAMPLQCGIQCRRHSCRCESDAQSCEIGIGGKPEGQ